MIPLLLSLCGAARAEALSPERFTVGLPAEVQLVGFGAGLHPELLWRPFHDDGALHLRAAAGFTAGRGHSTAPFTLGVREVLGRGWRVHPVLGAGAQLQLFLPYDHPVLPRVDMFMELGLSVDLNEGWSVGAELSPEIGMTGFGLGLGARLAVRKDLPW